jgi:hypothetical protein
MPRNDKGGVTPPFLLSLRHFFTVIAPLLPVIASLFIVIASEARQSQESKILNTRQCERAISSQRLANG